MKATNRHRTVSTYLRQNAIALLALFFAISGGVAWATHPGGTNTIDSRDIINDEVQSRDIGDGEVAVQDITAGAVRSGEVLDESLDGNDINEAGLGPVPLVANPSFDINTAFVTVPGGSQDDGNGNGVSRAVSVQCEPGFRAIGGGAYWDSNVNADSDELENRLHSAAFINSDGIPISSTSAVATGYRARGEVDQDGDHRLVLQVMCMRSG
jgi:hypothetical protein